MNHDIEIVQEHVKGLTSQPIPDYVTWYNTSGKLHYVQLEKVTYLETEIVDATPGAFLPSKVLDITYKVFKHDVNNIIWGIAVLSWCTEDEVSTYFIEQSEKLDKAFENAKEQDYWRQHDLYQKNNKTELKCLCQEHKLSPEGKKHEIVKRVVEKLGLPHPPALERYDGDLQNSLACQSTDYERYFVIIMLLIVVQKTSLPSELECLLVEWVDLLFRGRFSQ